jgi:hypothetical protein
MSAAAAQEQKLNEKQTGITGVASVYKDQNDHDTLRADPDGGRGRCAFGAGPDRMGVSIELETSGQQPCGKGFESSELNPLSPL